MLSRVVFNICEAPQHLKRLSGGRIETKYRFAANFSKHALNRSRTLHATGLQDKESTATRRGA